MSYIMRYNNEVVCVVDVLCQRSKLNTKIFFLCHLLLIIIVAILLIHRFKCRQSSIFPRSNPIITRRSSPITKLVWTWNKEHNYLLPLCWIIYWKKKKMHEQTDQLFLLPYKFIQKCFCDVQHRQYLYTSIRE